MKVIVAGSRNFKDYTYLENYLDYLFKNNKPDVIISGMARGADTLALRYAKEHNIKVIEMPADWSIGMHAGHVRNEDMARIATHCVIFWDGVSTGTKNMLSLCKKYELKHRVKIYENM